MARRVREPGSNVTDETRQEAIRSLSSTYAAIKQANSAHQTECKRLQQAGIKTKIAMKVIRERYKDQDEVLADLHEEIRLRALTDMPHIQQSLADLWSPPEVSDAAAAEQRRWQWREAGALAARNGHARDANPHLVGTEERVIWNEGWLQSPERIAAEMAAGDAPTVDTTPTTRRRRSAGMPPPTGSNGSRRRRVAV